MILDISKVKRVKTFGADYGMTSRQAPYSEEWVYKMLNPEHLTPASKELQEKFTLIRIDGMQFVMPKEGILNASPTGHTITPAAQPYHRPSRLQDLRQELTLHQPGTPEHERITRLITESESERAKPGPAPAGSDEMQTALNFLSERDNDLEKKERRAGRTAGKAAAPKKAAAKGLKALFGKGNRGSVKLVAKKAATPKKATAKKAAAKKAAAKKGSAKGLNSFRVLPKKAGAKVPTKKTASKKSATNKTAVKKAAGKRGRPVGSKNKMK